MNIKAIFFDIDGTLQTTDLQPSVPDSTRLALKKLREQGIKLFIATGRPISLTTDFQKLIDFEFDGWVTTNGQYCFVHDQVIRDSTLDTNEILELFKLLKQKHIVGVIQHQTKGYQNYPDDFFQFPIEEIIDEHNEGHVFDDSPICQVMVKLDEKEVETEKEIFEIVKNGKATRWTHIYFDLIPKDGGKNKGIDAMLEYFGIDLKDTMAFGDGENDVSMIKHVGLGVALGNARQELKDVADYITDDMREDGLYNALVHFGVIK